MLTQSLRIVRCGIRIRSLSCKLLRSGRCVRLSKQEQVKLMVEFNTSFGSAKWLLSDDQFKIAQPRSPRPFCGVRALSEIPDVLLVRRGREWMATLTPDRRTEGRILAQPHTRARRILVRREEGRTRRRCDQRSAGAPTGWRCQSDSPPILGAPERRDWPYTGTGCPHRKVLSSVLCRISFQPPD